MSNTWTPAIWKVTKAEGSREKGEEGREAGGGEGEKEKREERRKEEGEKGEKGVNKQSIYVRVHTTVCTYIHVHGG